MRVRDIAVPSLTSLVEERTSWWLVWRSVAEAVDLALADASLVRRLGIDEASFRRGLRFHTPFVDLDRRRLLDLVPERTKRSVTDWTSERTGEWKARVAEVVIDPFDAYRQRVGEALPQVTLVVDKFHAVQLANQALDAVRPLLQREVGHYRSRRSRSVAPPHTNGSWAFRSRPWPASCGGSAART